MSAAKAIDRGAPILQWEGKRVVCMARRSLEFSSVVSKEGKRYVAHCPELEITSQEKTVELALENLRRLSSCTSRMKSPRFFERLESLGVSAFKQATI